MTRPKIAVTALIVAHGRPSAPDGPEADIAALALGKAAAVEAAA